MQTNIGTIGRRGALYALYARWFFPFPSPSTPARRAIKIAADEAFLLYLFHVDSRYIDAKNEKEFLSSC